MNRPSVDVELVEAALCRWLERVDYRSYDPYDGLSRLPVSFIMRHPLAARIVMQAVKRSPVNLRPLLGIRRRVLAKSLSDIASASLWRYRLDGDPGALRRARRMLERLRGEGCSGYAGMCWGLATPYVTRFTRSPGGDPNLFWTIQAAVSFLEAYELEGRAEDLETARSSVDFILKDLGIHDEGEHGVWFPYFIAQPSAIYNVTALCAALLKRIGRHTGEKALVTIGARALHFVLLHQNDDGSWCYAREAGGRWVDGFHTGYVLEALLQEELVEDDPVIRLAFMRGVQYYISRLFTPDGLPRYSPDRVFPIEVQNCAQAIQTLARLTWHEPELLPAAERTAQAVVARLFRWTNRDGRSEGYFLMSRGRWFADRTPTVRWGGAPMLLALDHLLAARRRLRPFWELRPPLQVGEPQQ